MAAASCTDGIFHAIASNCTTAHTGGLEATAYVINRRDASITFSATTPNMITGITLATGKHAYKINAYKKGINAGHTIVVSDNRPDLFSQYVSFEGFEMSADAMINLTNLNDVIVVVETRAKTATGEGVFLAYGVKNGLWKTEDTQDWNADAGSRKIKLQSLGGNEEPYPAWVVFSTDYATTKSLLEGLTA